MRHQIAGDTWLDNLARASLSAADVKFGDGGRVPILAVDFSEDIDASALAVVSSSVQNAVARMSKYLANSSSAATQLRETDRYLARLFPRRQFGRRIEFGFESPSEVDSQLFYAHSVETMAEKAARELIEVLPVSADDQEAVSATFARDRAPLNAVRDIALAVEQTAGIGMSLTTHLGDQYGSIVTLDQARRISEGLKEGVEMERESIEVTGRIDGMRTRRRIFYLESNTRAYEGAFENDLVDAVKAHIDRPVIAVLERVRPLKKAGPRGRWSYRLVALGDAPQDVSLFDDLD
ncbi:hypothetical protein [Rhodococcus sp. UNC363MFTsu5.1]|uniref:hypothetical protein n=1 Tax=Rhodococcus sp. UNC363MFTsu5.1 TaxID=1449069 RepID=UPI0012DE5C25|nr:hypothetical protein [Rhodococcus sp. UNC363MFTsu5.1]